MPLNRPAIPRKFPPAPRSTTGAASTWTWGSPWTSSCSSRSAPLGQPTFPLERVPHDYNPRMQLIDIGANLAHDSFDADRDAVLQRALQAGVVQMVVTGSSEESSAKAIELSRAHPDVLFATAGVHPHHAADLTADTLPALRELARFPEVRAAGE